MWKPSCSHEAIRARAELYAQIRAFFVARKVLEVETPVLSRSGSTDPYLASMTAQSSSQYYLQTSPEFAMKRLLASGLGDIFQLCKTFRADEVGGRHNPEFTMLEWYRVGYDLPQLQAEISDLVCQVLSLPSPVQLSYKEAFQKYLSINPFRATLEQLNQACLRHAHYTGDALDRDACLDLLVSLCIEPKLGFDAPCYLVDYPASQASLARVALDEDGDAVGKRAELYVQGIELANAYDELVDGAEQQARFEEDQAQRQHLGLPVVPYDQHLVAALTFGLPECAGVALGVDRLLMLKLGCSNICEVLSFPDARA